MKYFNNCKTAEDVKKTFKELAKKFHPDCGGDAEEFKKMMAEYKIVFEKLKTVHVSAAGVEYTKETNETAEEYADIINKVIHFEGVKIEIIGSWIWLSGDTLLYKEEIKKAGFFWSSTKKAWYYNGETQKSTRRGRYTMTKLREMWGTTEVETEKVLKLA